MIVPYHAKGNVGALVYELLSGKRLFEVGNNLADYQSKLASIHLMDLSGCPPQLLTTLKAMLSTQPSARPNANAFSGAPYFQVPTLSPSPLPRIDGTPKFERGPIIQAGHLL
jgi:hypothetical protein